jgi:predicted MFS family arabinose efflux permease
VTEPSATGATTATAGSDDRLLGGYAGRILVILTAGYGTLKVARYALPTVLPLVIAELGIDSVRAGIALSTVVAAVAITQYPSGRYADGLSRATVVLVAVGSLVVGLATLSISPTYLALLAGAALLGVGEGLYSPASRALISDLFDDRRGQAFGVHMTSVDVGGLAAAGIATVLLATGRWRAAFLPLAALIGLIGLVYLRLNHEPLAVGRVPLDARRTARRLLGSPELRLLTVAYCLFMLTIQGVLGFLPTLLQSDLGLAPGRASLVFAALFAAGLAIKPLTGRLSDRIARPVVGGTATLVGAVGVAALALADGPLAAGVATVGVAVGAKGFGPAMQAHLMDTVPEGSMAGDFGALRTVYMGVGALGPVYVGVVAARFDYGAAFLGLAAAFAGASALVLYGWRRY